MTKDNEAVMKKHTSKEKGGGQRKSDYSLWVKTVMSILVSLTSRRICRNIKEERMAHISIGHPNLMNVTSSKFPTEWSAFSHTSPITMTIKTNGHTSDMEQQAVHQKPTSPEFMQIYVFL